MSRVHDALRRAEKSGEGAPPIVQPSGQSSVLSPAPSGNNSNPEPKAPAAAIELGANLAGLLELVEEVPFRTATDSLLIDASRPHEAPMEEFRTLRTRLNHMQIIY
jgi:protein-tyrosine kinase